MKIYLYCGASTEPWAPPAVASGVGGSEEMAIYLMREIARQGHEVTVFNYCGDQEGIYEGVQYLNYEDYPKDATCDVLIVWRTPQLYTKVKHTTAKKRYLWLHDTVTETEVLPFIYLYDKVMVLSQYHRELYPHIPNEQIMLTRNAVVMTDFDQKIERDPFLVVYGSSYDRGLKEVLEAWSEVKLRVPEAKLHIFYGWQTFDRLAELREDDNAKLFKDYIESLMKQEGVTHLGRISHQEVAKQYLSASIWAYPTWWPEISCISAMKAQIGGAVPVVVPTAAVDETVLLGYKTPTDPKAFAGREVDRAHLAVWTGLLIEALRDQKALEANRKIMMFLSRAKYGFESLADDWIKEFQS